MEELERPRAMALSEAELALALQKFPSDATGLKAASDLMREQQELRQQDAENFNRWISALAERDDALARQTLSSVVSKYFPQPAKEATEEFVEPTLTTEIPISRRALSRRTQAISDFTQTLSAAVALTLASLVTVVGLKLSASDSAVAIGVGLSLAVLVSLILKSHTLHPILRSASVFGGRGVYFFAGVILSLLGFFTSQAAFGDELFALAFVGPFSAVLVLVGTLALGTAQIVPVKFSSAVLLLVGFSALVSSGWSLKLAQFAAVTPDSITGAIAVFLAGVLVNLFGMPHSRPKHVGVSLTAGHALAILTAGTLVIFSVSVSSIFLVFIIFFGFTTCAFSGRDLAGGILGRLAALAPILGLLVSAFSEWLMGPLLSMAACSVILLVLDQLARRSALHIASLDTSHGFYGGIQIWAFAALVISAVAGVSQLRTLFSPSLGSWEWAVISGLAVGVLVGLIRIPIVRRQDLEIKSAGSAGAELHHLLGL